MTTQEIRTRNWQKARLMGFNLDSRILTVKEKEIYSLILEHKKILIDFWDNNTEELIGYPLPPYKCNWCGKRSNKEHLINGDNFCMKHFMAQTMTI